MCSFHRYLWVILLFGMISSPVAADFIPEETETVASCAVGAADGPALCIILTADPEIGRAAYVPDTPVSGHSLRRMVYRLAADQGRQDAPWCFSPELEWLGWLFPCLCGRQHFLLGNF
ncbi:MAG: hypothetical protein JXQ27_01545 [Acidobacteria bacterium]|nr:hypothetical protein [Acidobacteriota bacterium]